MYSMSGKHYFAVFYKCQKNIEALNDIHKLKKLCQKAMEKGKIKYYSSTGKRWRGQGVTLLYVIGESHFSAHTYPECSGVLIDIAVCGNEGSPQKCIDNLKKVFGAEEVEENYFTW